MDNIEINNSLMSSQEKNVRNSSIELLRIIAMIMIVFHHFAVHSGFYFAQGEIGITQFWIGFLSMGGKIGVDIFVLISGYFLIKDSQKLNLHKIIRFWFQVLFYSIVFYILSIILKKDTFNFDSFIKAILPISFSQWWFASTWFVLFLIHPFLNLILNKMDKKTYQVFLIVCIFLWCIYGTFTNHFLELNSLIWFVVLYSIAGYVKIYDFNPKITQKGYFLIFIISFLVTYFSFIIFSILGIKFNFFYTHNTFLFGMEKLTILVTSFSLFMSFKKLQMKNNKFINIIASASFGVYLIHDNPCVRYLLWVDIFKNKALQNNILIFPYSIGVCLLVYSVCTLIELIRKLFLEKNIMKILNKPINSIENAIKKIGNFICNLLFNENEKKLDNR